MLSFSDNEAYFNPISDDCKPDGLDYCVFLFSPPPGSSPFSPASRAMMNPIFVLGSTNTDMTIRGERLPLPGETISDGSFLMAAGGKGANQAVAVARLYPKGRCVFLGKVGDDLFGRETEARLKAEGIEPRLVVDREQASGTALILVDRQGQNCISVALGANGTFSPQEALPLLQDLSQAAALLLQLETPMETVLQAARAARQAGVPVLLNPAPARELPPELYPLLDWITPNEREAQQLTGVPVEDEESAARAAGILQARGVPHVLITLGSRGCWCSATGRLHPAREVKAVDCVAAGDTFNGAFAVALAESLSWEEAIAFAQEAAALSVTRPGAQPSIPRREELSR